MKTFREAAAKSLDITPGKIENDATIHTGFRRLDTLLGGGLGQGELTVLAAPEADGITFALSIVKNLLEHVLRTGICFCSARSSSELASRLLDVACGPEDRALRTRWVSEMADVPLYFVEIGSDGASAAVQEIKAMSLENSFGLLIAEGVSPDDLCALRSFARELGNAVLALTPEHCVREVQPEADSVILLARMDEEEDPDLGAPVEVTVVKSSHGSRGVCGGYFVPPHMAYRESCAGDEIFVAIPETYEAVTPCGELKKYITPEHLPLLPHLRAEIGLEDRTQLLSRVLSLSACLEAVGDHENAVKVFRTGRNRCRIYEEGAQMVYDRLYAAQYYWLFRDMDNARRCMELAKAMADEDSEKEYEELERRMRTYHPAEWIKEEEIC